MAILAWKPWEAFKPIEDILPLQGPPCQHCENWRPIRKYSSVGYNGVVCCHSKEMEHDFSCYKPKEY